MSAGRDFAEDSLRLIPLAWSLKPRVLHPHLREDSGMTTVPRACLITGSSGQACRKGEMPDSCNHNARRRSKEECMLLINCTPRGCTASIPNMSHTLMAEYMYKLGLMLGLKALVCSHYRISWQVSSTSCLWRASEQPLCQFGHLA